MGTGRCRLAHDRGGKRLRAGIVVYVAQRTLPSEIVCGRCRCLACGRPALLDQKTSGTTVECFGMGEPNLAPAYNPGYVSTMTAKERLRNLVDELSEEEAATALMVVERRRLDPMLRALANAVDDDEPTSPQEDDSARRALVEYERGEALSPSELRRDLGIV